MPYIENSRRGALEQPITVAAAENSGELNFQITKLCLGYLERKGECYQTYNDIMGALSGADKELYRVQIASYEQEKCKINGDVYPHSLTEK